MGADESSSDDPPFRKKEIISSSGTRSVGPRLRATVAAYHCSSALERHDFEAARLEYWVLHQALYELEKKNESSDAGLAALQARGRDLGRMLAMRVTPREFRRSEG